MKSIDLAIIFSGILNYGHEKVCSILDSGQNAIIHLHMEACAGRAGGRCLKLDAQFTFWPLACQF